MVCLNHIVMQSFHMDINLWDVSQHAVCVIHGNKWEHKFSTELTLKSQNIANVEIYRDLIQASGFLVTTEAI
jgi:hypothetical protein